MSPRQSDQETKRSNLSFLWAARRMLSTVRRTTVVPAPVDSSQISSASDAQSHPPVPSVSLNSRTSYNFGAVPHRSSMRGSFAGKRMRRKKHVRFKGVGSTYTRFFTALLVHVFRSGSPVTASWEFIVACGICVGVPILLPLVGSVFAENFV